MKREGFTLIEFIIVCAIIGILATVAIPTFTKYKREAAAANAEQTISDCITLFIASKINNEISSSTYSCKVGENILTLEIDNNNQVSISGTNTATIKNIKVNCTINNNHVDCIPI